MKKFPHFKVRNPLLSAAPKFKATKRFVYRAGVIVELDRAGNVVASRNTEKKS